MIDDEDFAGEYGASAAPIPAFQPPLIMNADVDFVSASMMTSAQIAEAALASNAAPAPISVDSAIIDLRRLAADLQDAQIKILQEFIGVECRLRKIEKCFEGKI